MVKKKVLDTTCMLSYRPLDNKQCSISYSSFFIHKNVLCSLVLFAFSLELRFAGGNMIEESEIYGLCQLLPCPLQEFTIYLEFNTFIKLINSAPPSLILHLRPWVLQVWKSERARFHICEITIACISNQWGNKL